MLGIARELRDDVTMRAGFFFDHLGLARSRVAIPFVTARRWKPVHFFFRFSRTFTKLFERSSSIVKPV